MWKQITKDATEWNLTHRPSAAGFLAIMLLRPGVHDISSSARLAWQDVPALAPSARPLLRRLAAVAFLDVVGYSRLMGGDEEVTLREWASLQRTLIEPRLRHWRGRVANRAGDGLLLEFDSALDAFRWAIEMQDGIAARSFDEVTLSVRIALHLGDVIDDADGEVQGDGVNVAARLQAHAPVAGIILSQALADTVAGKTDRVLADLGWLSLKNINRPIRAFRVLDPAEPSNAADAPGRGRRVAWLGLALAVAAAIPALLILSPGWRHPGASPSQAAHSTSLGTAREVARQLFEQGRSVACTEHPCPRAWLASRAFYERAIAADPSYGVPYAYAALTYTILIANNLSLDEDADLHSAERLAMQASALSPDDAATYRARGAVLEMQPDRLQDALAAYDRSLAIEPAQPVVQADIGWILILLGRAGAAEPFLRQALTASPHHLYAPAWLTYLGLAELFLDQDGHGAPQLREAIALQSQQMANGDIALQRSIILVAALALDGRLDAAKNLVRELRQRHPMLSTQAMWNCGCSREPGYLAGVARLQHGLELAGIPSTP